jgi:cyclophilin family peptidyl-prolyl cis-trans isomerase
MGFASNAYQPMEINTLKYLGIAAAAAKRGAEHLLPYSMGPDPAPLKEMVLDKVWELDGSDVPSLPSFLQQDQTAHRALRLRGSGAVVPTDNNEVVLQIVQRTGWAPTPVRIRLHPEWAPIGVAQFQKLVASHYKDQAAFFRVVPGFIAQFGLPAMPMPKWAPLQDDPVVVTNARGTVTFATSGPNTRSNQLFINLGNNANLDSRGFSPIGEIVEGMEAVDAINTEYGERPDQGWITTMGNMYLDQQFPNLSKVQSASLR